MISSVTALIRPQPAVSPIADANEREKVGRRWKIRILFSMFVGYSVYYFTRSSLGMITPSLKDLGYSVQMFGWMITIFHVVYGISKFVNGLIADRASSRLLMAIGLAVSGVFSIGFGLSGSPVAFLIFWSLQGWVQGCGSAPCHRLLTEWYPKKERGRWWSIWNASHNVGTALFPLMAVWLLDHYGWKSVMIVPGVIALTISFFILNRLRDEPVQVGLPPVDQGKVSKESADDKDKPTYSQLLFKYVLNNPGVWLLAVAYFMVYVIRWTIQNWGFFYLCSSCGYSKGVAAQCMMWNQIGGFAGGLAAGWLSDVFFRGKRTIVNISFLAVLIPMTYFFTQLSSHSGSVWMVEVSFALMGFFIFGPQMLLAVQAAEVCTSKAAATAVGFLGIIAYVGASATGTPLTAYVKATSWSQAFTLLEFCALIGALSLIPLFYLAKKKAVAAATA